MQRRLLDSDARECAGLVARTSTFWATLPNPPAQYAPALLPESSLLRTFSDFAHEETLHLITVLPQQDPIHQQARQG